MPTLYAKSRLKNLPIRSTSPDSSVCIELCLSVGEDLDVSLLGKNTDFLRLPLTCHGFYMAVSAGCHVRRAKDIVPSLDLGTPNTPTPSLPPSYRLLSSTNWSSCLPYYCMKDTFCRHGDQPPSNPSRTPPTVKLRTTALLNRTAPSSFCLVFVKTFRPQSTLFIESELPFDPLQPIKDLVERLPSGVQYERKIDVSHFHYLIYVLSLWRVWRAEK